MSIFYHCQKCFGSFSLELDKCPTCETPVPAKGRKFRISLMVDGRRITRVIKNSLAVARQTEAELRIGAGRGDVPAAKSKLTLDEAFQNYYDNNPIKNMDHLRWDYEKHIKPRFGLYPLNKITTVLIETFKYDLLKTFSPKTVKNIIMIISATINFARRLGYAGQNPLEKVTKPKIQNEVMNILTDQQRASLVEVLDKYHLRIQASAIKLLIYTGLRVSEALKLEWHDIDFDKRCIYIRDAKSGYNESIPMNETAYKIISERKQSEEAKIYPLVFPGENGQKFHKINFSWNKIKKLAGLPDKIRLHDLRHDFATRLANTGEVSLQMIGRLLRHRSAAMTQRYAHLVDETLRKAAEKIR